MQKRILALTLFLAILAFAIPGQANAQGINGTLFFVGSKEYISGKYVYNMDVAPFIENGRTYVPVRYLANALEISDSEIKWSSENNEVFLSKENIRVVLNPGSRLLFKYDYPGQIETLPVTMDVSPVIRHNRVFLPARYIAEAFGETVSWEPETNGVLISRNYTQPSQQQAYTKQKTTGQQTITFQDGGSYTGDVLNGLPHGKGRLTAANGMTIEGDFVNGYTDGNVVINFNNGGGSYTGTFRNNSGKGTMVFPNGDKLTGSFIGGACNGYGEYTWPSGDTYKGNFLNNKFNGEGTMYYRNGAVATGIWENGQLVRWLANTSESSPGQTPINRVPITANPDDTIYYPTIRNTTTSGVIESKIDGNFNGWDGDTIFVLVNGQIWQQDSYSYTYHYSYRPNVIIYPSGGRYKMHVEGVDKDIYVKRLK